VYDYGLKTFVIIRPLFMIWLGRFLGISVQLVVLMP